MAFEIPLFELNYGEEEEQELLATLRSRWISTGPRAAAFEAEFAATVGAPHAVALANCTAALELALAVLGIGPGDEVIVPSLTFVATVSAVVRVGAQPVFADVASLDDPTLDPEHIEALVGPRTRGVVVMHYAGFPCAMDRILEIARRRGLKVVEDACHGPLSRHGDACLGTLGHVGCFSFFSNKNISTGEGGMLVTGDAALAAHARLLRSHGMTSLSYDRAAGHSTGYDVLEPGTNVRMDDLHAALGLAQLRKLPRDLEKRARVRSAYLEEIGDVPGLVVPFRAHVGFVSNYIFPVALARPDAARRDAVRRRLADEGIQTSVHYPPVHRFSAYRGRGATLPVTEAYADATITLPMHAGLDAGRISKVAGALKKALAA